MLQGFCKQLEKMLFHGNLIFDLIRLQGKEIGELCYQFLLSNVVFIYVESIPQNVGITK